MPLYLHSSLFFEQQKRHALRQTLHVRMGSVSRLDGGVMENRSVKTVRMKQTPPAVSTVIVCAHVFVDYGIFIQIYECKHGEFHLKVSITIPNFRVIKISY